jgi:hypothetical protein
MPRPTVLACNVELVDCTPHAICIEFDDGSSGPVININRFWIPRTCLADSNIAFNAEDLEDEWIGDVEIFEWFVDEKDGLRDAIDLEDSK